jgi:thioredoxin reductase (NADPH)
VRFIFIFQANLYILKAVVICQVMFMKTYDVIVIGAGVSGFAAAMYAGRLAMKTLVIGDTVGGTIILTNIVENYPGFIRLTGQELADNIKNHAMDYKDFVELEEKKVTKIEKKDDGFVVHMGEDIVESKTVIFATGTKWRQLEVSGNDKYQNRGIHYCALCDGFFYRGKTVAIVGGSDSAAKDALVLAEHAEKVYMIYRGENIHPEPPTARRVAANKKIEIINKTNITEILGDTNKVTGVVLDNPYNNNKVLKLDGLFIAIGHIALSELAKEVGVKTNDKGEIIINRRAETNVPGFFAAGDVVDTHFKQAIVGVAEGVIAAYDAYEYINSKA